MKKFLLTFAGLVFAAANLFAQPAQPVRIAIAGLVHDHAYGFIPRFEGRTDVQLVGIVETNVDLIQRYAEKFHLSPGIFYPSLDALLAKTNVQAVAAFTDILDHTAVVKFCAAHGLDVMMEKPLATDMKQARLIEAAVKESGIQLVVNYETSWYPGNQAAYVMVHDQHQIGDIRRMVFHDGHNGPKEIGCSTNFLAWLTDPVLNGGGAINDFGCYGADIATWWMDGRKPVSVFATAHHYKPGIYPKVEDDATIVLNYTTATVILQPSWDWPFNWKDMAIYGQTGYVLVPQPDMLRVRHSQDAAETEITPPALTAPNDDPLSYFAAVARGDIKPTGLASLDVNVTVVEILDAAQKSVRTGKIVKLE